jgi:hypothetical protein
MDEAGVDTVDSEHRSISPFEIHRMKYISIILCFSGQLSLRSPVKIGIYYLVAGAIKI